MSLTSSFKIAIVSLSVKTLSTIEFAQKLKSFVKKAKEGGADLILFPEVAMVPLLEVTGNNWIKATVVLENEIKKLAQHYKIYICGGSGVYEVDGKVLNRSFLITPVGEIIYQTKLNIVECEKQMGRTPGSQHHNQIKIITTPFIKMAICVCYDIEFPELVRQAVLQGADLILNPSYTIDQFGEHRIKFCAQARTIENHIYVATARLVGNGGYELTATGFGKSALYSPCDIGFSPDGIVAETKSNTEEELIIAEVDLAKLYKLRKECSTSPLRDYSEFAKYKLEFQSINK